MKAGGVGYGDLKKELAAVTRELLAPFKEKFKRFAERPDEVEAVLRDGAARARALASPIIEKARQATGLSR
jgi:tryptophanyl-tRNA synthetase